MHFVFVIVTKYLFICHSFAVQRPVNFQTDCSRTSLLPRSRPPRPSATLKAALCNNLRRLRSQLPRNVLRARFPQVSFRGPGDPASRFAGAAFTPAKSSPAQPWTPPSTETMPASQRLKTKRPYLVPLPIAEKRRLTTTAGSLVSSSSWIHLLDTPDSEEEF